MFDPVSTLSLLVLVSAALLLGGAYGGRRVLVYVFKPLATVLLLVMAALAPAPPSPAYQAAVCAGLACSLAGDVCLMLPSDRFVAGLVSFLLAHLCYAGAFWTQAYPSFTPLAGAVLVACGAVLLRVLWPHLGALKAPVVVYAAALLAMGWLALEQGMRTGDAFAAAGALLFIASDSVLAYNRFVRPFRAAALVVLGTYYAAQWLIARSAWG